MRDLARESFALLIREEKLSEDLHDYAFIVFPIAKAYEGFLKKLFLDLGLISQQQFSGDRFRIGRALNPNLPKRYQWDWVYDKLTLVCRGEEIPREMWQMWRVARNQIFHFFPDHHEFITLGRARELVEGVAEVMDKTLRACRT